MNDLKQQELKARWADEQKNIRETVTSANNELAVTFNGNVEITALKIMDNIPVGQLETLLISCINAGIKSTSLKAQYAFTQFRKRNNI